MPIYEYVCASCKKKTEVIQRARQAPPKVCPHCGGKLKKAISVPAIQFKGSGFYITDYASGDRKSGALKAESDKSEGASSAKSEGASSAKSEGASSAKSEKSEKSESAGKSEKVEKKTEKKEKKASGD
jgi:putative FmdB family regulatory protein